MATIGINPWKRFCSSLIAITKQVGRHTT